MVLLPNGFLGKEAYDYLNAVHTAMDIAHDVHMQNPFDNVAIGTPPPPALPNRINRQLRHTLESAKTGQPNFATGDKNNIVMRDQDGSCGSPPNDAANCLYRATDESSYGFHNIINKLLDVCQNHFRMPHTTARVVEMLNEIKDSLPAYHEGAYEAVTALRTYSYNMSGDTVWNIPNAEQVRSECVTDISLQLFHMRDTAIAYRDMSTSLEGQISTQNNIAATATKQVSSFNPATNSWSSSTVADTVARSNASAASSTLSGYRGAVDSYRTTLSNAIDDLEMAITNTNNLFFDYRYDIIAYDNAAASKLGYALEMERAQTNFYLSFADMVPADILAAGGVGLADAMLEFAFAHMLDKALYKLGTITDEETIQALLNAFESFTLLDKIEVLNIIYVAPSPFRCLLFAFADKINIVCIESNGLFRRVFENGEVVETRIYFNLERDRNNPRGPFFTLFHEIGHMIDFYFGQMVEAGGTFSRHHDQFGEDLFRAIRNDVENQLISVANQIFPDFFVERALLSEAISNIMAGSRVLYGDDLTAVERLQLEIQENMNAILSGRANPELPNKMRDNMFSVSDVFAGMTNSAVITNYRDPRPNDYYWFRRDGSPTYRQNSELFAHVFAYGMRNDTDAMENVRHYLPTASAEMDNVLAHMESVIRTED